MADSDTQDPRSDQELVNALNRGDSAAFDVLYFRHREWVVNLSFRFTRDRDAALDVLQETFVYFAKKFPGFKLTAQLRTFFYPAVKNLSLASKRKAERLQPLPDDGLHETPAPENPAASERDEIFAALEGISEEQREVLTLRFIDGFQLGEIAAAMGIPIGTVKSRLHNALTALRKDPRTKKL
ncbi:MAG: RNA polymerase sigma factor, partial [Limisphaerales bacterium]